MIVAGFGFRASASLDSLRNAYQQVAKDQLVSALAAPEDKARAKCLKDLAAEVALPICAITPQELSKAETTTRSQRIQDLRNTGSVAEASALAAAGQGAYLVASRVISEDRLATCAIAMGESE